MASLVLDKDLTAATETITAARTNPNGAVVVCFVHGWHHSARWDFSDDSGDAHFAAFRVLRSLTLRKAERYFTDPASGGRRVVGVYIGRNGDPTCRWTNAGALTHVSFWNRYRAAKQIGDGE